MKRRDLKTGRGGGGRFKRLDHGKYACPDCGLVFEGFAARQDAIRHSRDGLCPVRLPDTHSGPFLAHRAQSNAPGDGYARPDSWGRWRLGRNAQEKRLIAYYKALYKLEKQADYQDKIYSVQHFLDTVFEKDGSYPKWAGKRSPLQRLAWAFHNHNWEQVKYCAYQLCYDDLVRKRIGEWFNHVSEVARHVEGFLADLDTEAFKDGDLTELIVKPEDLNIN